MKPLQQVHNDLEDAFRNSREYLRDIESLLNRLEGSGSDEGVKKEKDTEFCLLHNLHEKTDEAQNICERIELIRNRLVDLIGFRDHPPVESSLGKVKESYSNPAKGIVDSRSGTYDMRK